MKIKNGFISRQVAGSNVVVATGEQSKNFSGIIKLNDSGKLLWDKLFSGATQDELIAALLDEYEIDRATAEVDVEKFIGELRNAGAVED